MSKKTILILLLILLILLVVYLIHYVYHKKLFQPTKKILATPKEPHDDIKENGIHLRYFPLESKNLSDVVLFCHGNNANLTYRTYIVHICRSMGYNLLLFDYPGYGLSEGQPNQYNILEAGKTALRYLTDTQKFSLDKIVVWGESLGGYVATYLASEFPVKALVLMSTFSSLSDVLEDNKSFLLKSMGYIGSFWLSVLPNKELIKKVKCKTVIIHSGDDRMIPIKHAWILFCTVPHNDKMLVPIAGDHADPQISPNSLINIFKFLDQKEEIHNTESLYFIAEKLAMIREELYKCPEFAPVCPKK